MNDNGQFCITAVGRTLLARLLAGSTLTITQVMFGSGSVPDDVDIYDTTALYTPVAVGTSNTPTATSGTMKMTVEYRNDLNGGLTNGFNLREFGVYGRIGSETPVLIYYANLGIHPQWVSPYSATDGKVDVRRFPISIAVGNDVGVELSYHGEIWMTEEDVHNYYVTTISPAFTILAEDKIAAHNVDTTAHPDIRATCASLLAQIDLLKLQSSIPVDNQFAFTFEVAPNSTDSTTVLTSGAWDGANACIQY